MIFNCGGPEAWTADGRHSDVAISLPGGGRLAIEARCRIAGVPDQGSGVFRSCPVLCDMW
jgi:hypothetical protein